MNWILASAIFVFLAGGTGLWWLVRRILSPDARLPLTAEWIDELSLERYRPMLRLLDPQELEVLGRQPGCTPRMARADRCRIFQGYLRCLNQDFARVVMALKLVLLQAHNDRPELAAALLRQQVLFAAGMASAQGRLFLYRWGWSGVDVTGLMRIFDTMRLELQNLVPATLGVQA